MQTATAPSIELKVVDGHIVVTATCNDMVYTQTRPVSSLLDETTIINALYERWQSEAPKAPRFKVTRE